MGQNSSRRCTLFAITCLYVGSSLLGLIHDRSKRPEKRHLLRPVATGQNQVWSWDITYLRDPVKGQFFYLYMIIDIFSRKVIGWRLHERETSFFASELVTKCLAKKKYRVKGSFFIQTTEAQ